MCYKIWNWYIVLGKGSVHSTLITFINCLEFGFVPHEYGDHAGLTEFLNIKRYFCIKIWQH